MTVFKQFVLASVTRKYIFTPIMKKTAAILLFIFTLVQVIPAVSSLFSTTNVVFVMDEEKGDERTEAEKKEKKENFTVSFGAEILSQHIDIAFHESEKIYPSPCLEKLTPPPNFC